MTLVRAKIDINIPRKRKGQCAQHEKGLQKFFDSIMQGILRYINFDGKKNRFNNLHKAHFCFSSSCEVCASSKSGFCQGSFL